MSAVSFRLLHSDEFESRMFQPGYIARGTISHPLWNLRGISRECVTSGWYAADCGRCVSAPRVSSPTVMRVGADLKAKDWAQSQCPPHPLIMMMMMMMMMVMMMLT